MKIISANTSHVAEIITLSDIAFGKGFLNQKVIANYIESSHKYIYVAIVNNQVAGFITAITCSKNDLHHEVLWEFNKIDINTNTTISIIKQVSVNPNFYRQGIANQLLKFILTELTRTDVWFCISWHKGETTPMNKLLSKNNFKSNQTIPNYWTTESITQNYNCTICGSPPCHCTAELFSLVIN